MTTFIKTLKRRKKMSMYYISWTVGCIFLKLKERQYNMHC